MGSHMFGNGYFISKIGENKYGGLNTAYKMLNYKVQGLKQYTGNIINVSANKILKKYENI